MIGAVAAASIRRDREIIAAFLEAEALSRRASRSLAELGIPDDVRFRRLAGRGLFVNTRDDHWFVDAERAGAYLSGKRRRMLIAVLVAAALVVLGVVLGGCGDTAGSTGGALSGGATGGDATPGAPRLIGKDCLVILLDALHAAHLGCYGGSPETSPAIDRLAGLGTRFDQAWSQASWTLPSTVSLFTGLYQETHGIQFGVGLEDLRLHDAAVTMAELFAAAGYDTACYTQNPFAGSHYGLDQGFAAFTEVRGDGPGMADDVAALLASPGERPRFTYVHFRRPHTPFDPSERFVESFVDADYDGPVTGTEDDVADHNGGRHPMTEADLGHHVGLYHANIRHVDQSVGRILSAVDTEQTLIVLLSDHGEAFDEHGRLGHNWMSFEEYVHIPMLMAHPSLPRGAVIDAPVMTIDVLPTLAELFGLPADPRRLQGTSLAPMLAGAAAPDRDAVFTSARVDAGGRRHLAVFDGTHKYVHVLPEGQGWLFELKADPGERVNLAEERPQVAARLRGQLLRWHEGQAALFVADADGEMDPETRARLEQLGYLDN